MYATPDPRWSNTRLPVPSRAAGGVARSASVRSSTRRALGCARSHETSAGRRSAARFGHFIGYSTSAPRHRLIQLLGKTIMARAVVSASNIGSTTAPRDAPASGVPCLTACANRRTRTPARVSAAYSAACAASTAARTLSRAAAALAAMNALSSAACALLSKAVGATINTWSQLCGAADCASGALSRSSVTRSTKPLRTAHASAAAWQSGNEVGRTAATDTRAAAPRAPSAPAQRCSASTRPPRRRARARERTAAKAR